MSSISRLLNPRSIAVVGASPRGGRGGRTLVNLRETKFSGPVFAINPRYDEVLGFPCYPSFEATPEPVDCAVIAIGAESACEALESAFARGVPAAVVLAAGFGEGGQNIERAQRLRRLGQSGMSICGPNCYGLLSIKEGATATAYSGRLPTPLLSGRVALVSQSGGLTNNSFTPLMSDRRLGFRYVVSCGNQIATSIEDYIEAFVDDPDVSVIAAIVESIRTPHKLLVAARKAHAAHKRLVFYPIGRTKAGREMTRSHTGALAGDAEVTAAFLRRCGVVCVDDYDQFVETMELFAIAPPESDVSHEIVVISGSGGAAAIAADALAGSSLSLPAFAAATKEKLRTALPDFGNVTNPLDGTGSMSDDPSVLEGVLKIILQEESRAIVATTLSAKHVASAKEHRFSEIISAAARASGRTIAAFQYSPLGGPLDDKIVERLHSAGAPLLLGSAMAMRVLRYLPLAQDYRRQVLARDWSREDSPAGGANDMRGALAGFLNLRGALTASGLSVVDADLVASEREALASFKRFACPVALKAEASGMLHKSDIGCVRLHCGDEEDVIDGYRSVLAKARQAGFDRLDGVLVQPMIEGVAEVYAGVKNDPVFGPAVCVGLGGVFVEIFNDVVTEIAPLSPQDAMDMILRLKASPILFGARGRPAADVDALADFLSRLSHFALANACAFEAMDLNPVIVKARGEGVTAVDIAVEPPIIRGAV